MNILLYYNSSDNRCVNKVLLGEKRVEGTLRESTSVINPVIALADIAPNSLVAPKYNYAYIAEFRRYYFINDSEPITNSNLFKITFKVDPLMSFKGDILALNVVIDKQASDSNGDEYIDDSSLITNNLTFNSVYNFSNGFNDSGEYILITAG